MMPVRIVVTVERHRCRSDLSPLSPCIRRFSAGSDLPSVMADLWCCWEVSLSKLDAGQSCDQVIGGRTDKSTLRLGHRLMFPMTDLPGQLKLPLSHVVPLQPATSKVGSES